VIRRRPNIRIGTVISRPRKDRGVISPYPTVVIVTNTNQAAAGIDENCVGSPSAFTNVSRIGSQVPRSEKYRRVLNTVRIIITKKPIAKSACCDLFTDIYITSIVSRTVLL